MKIHKEGYKILLTTTIALLLLNTLLHHFCGKSLLFYFILAVSITLFLIVLNFFRSPARIFPESDENILAAPADGTIVVIEEVVENEYFGGEKKLQVSIFMSVFNAHVNWYPINGKILHSSHQHGRFMAAYLPKSSTENERSTVVIETANGEQILVRQIAGAVAKRIVTYAKEGDPCHVNEQLGFIKFGSRVDLFLPIGSEVLVDMDQKVSGNRTAIARLQ